MKSDVIITILLEHEQLKFTYIICMYVLVMESKNFN